MEVFKGKYERTSAENYEEFLKAMDVGYLLRKAATVSTPTLEVTESGGIWSIKTSTTLKSMELKFKVIKDNLSSWFRPTCTLLAWCRVLRDDPRRSGGDLVGHIRQGTDHNRPDSKKAGPEKHKVSARDERRQRAGLHHEH